MKNFFDTPAKRQTALGGFLIIALLTLGFAAGHSAGYSQRAGEDLRCGSVTSEQVTEYLKLYTSTMSSR